MNDLQKLRNRVAIQAERLIRKKEGLHSYTIERRDSHNTGYNFESYGVSVFLWPNPNPEDSTYLHLDIRDYVSQDENMKEVHIFIETIKAYVPRAASATVPA